MEGQRCPKWRSVLALLLTLWSLAKSEECIQDQNCRLPDCFCPTFTHPLGAENIPQIVYFGFDDAVQPQVSGYYDQLFKKERQNPNGCPITKTLYVSNDSTIYSLVSKYYKAGDEIAIHSVTHTNIDTGSKLRTEATEQRHIIEEKAKVPEGEMIGWRSPNLKTAGDDQPRVLRELGFTYDISLTYDRDLNFPFPFTMDYGYPYPCSIQPCPSVDSKYSGFWEVMVHGYKDPKTDLPCTYVDSCRPDSEDDALEFLWQNFLDTYENERAPFGLNMHAAWFYYPEYLAAMDRFIERLLGYPDVYIVSVAKMIEWMKNPTTLSNIQYFEPWGCSATTKKRSTVVQSTTRPAETTTSQVIHQPKNILSSLHPAAPKIEPEDHASQYVPSWNHRYNQNPRPNPINFKPVPPSSPSTTVSTRRPVFFHRITNQRYFDKDESSKEPVTCVQGVNCKLPECFCKTASPPKGLPRRFPQIVYLSIDSHIDGRTFGPLMEIFSSPRVNYNGCPVSGSIFLPLSGNYPPYATTLVHMGAKVGVRLGRDTNLENLRQVVADEIDEFGRGIPAHYGMRSVGVDTKFNDALETLKTQNNSFYNFIVKESSQISWPYTLDFGLTQRRCSSPSHCPKVSYPGIWHVPLSPLQIPGQPGVCLAPSSCPFLFRNDIDTFRTLKYNFDRHYFTERVPFGINIDENWLLGRGGRARVRGLNVFLNNILNKPDVAVVSIDKLLQFIKSSDKYGSILPC